MRTQEEIQKQLRKIEAEQTDATGKQTHYLISKLSWENAKSYVNPKYHTDQQQRTKWSSKGRLDHKALIHELDEIMDSYWFHFYGEEWVQANIIFDLLIINLWLQKQERLLAQVFNLYNFWNKDQGKILMEFVCKEFAFKLKKYRRRYQKIQIVEQGD